MPSFPSIKGAAYCGGVGSCGLSVCNYVCVGLQQACRCKSSLLQRNYSDDHDDDEALTSQVSPRIVLAATVFPAGPPPPSCLSGPPCRASAGLILLPSSTTRGTLANDAGNRLWEWFGFGRYGLDGYDARHQVGPAASPVKDTSNMITTPH